MDELLDSVTPADLEQMKTDIGETATDTGDSGEQPEASPQEAKEVTEEAPTETPTKESAQTTETKEESQPASEGEKTPSEKTIEPTVRRSKSIPYERFLKVIKERNELRDKLSSQTPNPAVAEVNQGVDTATQPAPEEYDPYTQEIIRQAEARVYKKLEPYIDTTAALAKEHVDAVNEQELAHLISETPEASKYSQEIRAYAHTHYTLPYKDVITLVLAKHNAEAQSKEKKQVEAESKEADLGGTSNSAARRRTATPHELSDEELEKQVGELEKQGKFSL